MVDDWDEVVTRQPLGNQRLDHLLSKEQFGRCLKNTPDMVKLRTVKCTDVASSNVCKITSHYSMFKQRKLIENQKRTH